MSELSDGVQIVMVSGKAAYLIGSLTFKAAVLALKTMNTVYLSKWKGKTSFERLRRIKGEDFMYINVSTERRELLSAIEKEMEAHGILMARLPDLCGGDGRTQYAISSSDAVKFKAFLLDHMYGTNKEIKVGPISAADYAQTGITHTDEPTPELKALTDSAAEQTKHELQAVTMQGKDRGLLEPMNGQEEQAIRKHDLNVTYKDRVRWIRRAPVKESDRWRLYEMEDGKLAVIPKEDMLMGETAVFCDQEYFVIDKAGQYTTIKGSEVIKHFEGPTLQEENERFKNRNRNLGRATEKYTRVTINERMFLQMEGVDYITRIPFQKDRYVKIPRDDCRMLQQGSEEHPVAALEANLYDKKEYRIVDHSMREVETVTGEKLKDNYNCYPYQQQRAAQRQDKIPAAAAKDRQAVPPKSKVEQGKRR